jgi:tetratricopeptide (TPR) repeat protein
MRTFRLLILLALSSIQVSAFAQNLDSLLQVADGMEASVDKAETLLDIAYQQNNISLYKEGIETSKKALQLFLDFSDKNGEALTLHTLSNCYIGYREYELAEQALDQAMQIYKNLNDEAGQANIHSTYGTLFTWRGGTIEYQIIAKEHLFEAISYRLEHNDYSALASDYFELAVISSDQSDVSKTLEYYYKVIEICRDRRYVDNVRSNRLAAAYANSGMTYKNAYENELAIEYYLKAIESLPDDANMSNRSIMLNHLGELYHRIHKYDLGLDYIYKSIRIGEDLHNDLRLEQGYRLLGDIHLENNDLDSAFYYLKMSHDLAIKTDFDLGISHNSIGNYYLSNGDINTAIIHFKNSIEPYDFVRAYNGLAKCYKLLGDFSNSTKFLELYVSKKDSLDNLLRIPAVSLANTKQEQELSSREKKRTEEEEAALVKERNYLQYSAAMLAIVILLLVLNLVISFKLPPLAIKAMAFITILTLFEFTLVYLDPHIEAFTDSEPLLKLGINVAIAALIFPVHNFIEKKMSK